ncbi:tRNA (adenosine(37)-N6)-dimethylallyltransferase MiaA [Planctomycetota bacterium]
MKKRLLILGVTASGKARLAFDLAQHYDAEIISIDSMKVYCRMDIGTAKPPVAARAKVPYHLLDVVEPHEAFSVGLFHEQALAAAHQIETRKRPVIAVGGTALYIKALLYGLFDGPAADETLRDQLKQRAQDEGLESMYRALQAVDPNAAARIDPNDQRRIIRALEVHKLTGKPISSFQTQFSTPQPSSNWTVIGLRRAKDVESRRINARVKKMIDLGLVDEVRSLLAEDRPLSKQAAAAIGYAEIIAHLQGQWDLLEAMEKIKINTRRLAKHQRTWFKTFPGIHWLDMDNEYPPEKLLDLVQSQYY